LLPSFLRQMRRSDRPTVPEDYTQRVVSKAYTQMAGRAG